MLMLFVAIQNKVAMAREEEGQTMAEYGVVLAVITIGIVATLGFLADDINAALDKVRDALL